MRTLLMALVAAGVIVAGGVAYVVGSAADAGAQEDTVQDDTGATETQTDADDEARSDADGDSVEDTQRSGRTSRVPVAPEVLDDLVADGVITQEQADAILDALNARLEELRAELGERRADGGEGLAPGGGRPFGGFQFGEFGDVREMLEDGVIDADELAELGADHPINDPEGPFAEFLDDGELTEDELKSALGELRGPGYHGPDDSSDDDSTGDEDAEDSTTN